MSFGASTHRITLTAEQMSAAVESLTGDVQRLVQGARPAGLAVQLCISHRVAGLPGLAARLATLRDCEVHALPRGAAALATLAARESISRPAASARARASVTRRCGRRHGRCAVGNACAGAGGVDPDARAVSRSCVADHRRAAHAWAGRSQTCRARCSLPAGIAGLSQIPLHSPATGRAGNRRGPQHLRHVRQ